MGKIFERNLACMANRTSDSDIEFLKNISKYPNKDITKVISKDGKSNILLNKDNRKVYLHSKYSIEKETQRWIEQFDRDKYDVLVVFGLGMGHHIKKFNNENPDIPILVLEPNQHIFIHALKNIDLTSILNKDHIRLIVGDDITNQINVLFEKWVYEMKYSKYFITCLSSYSNLYSEEFKAINEIIWRMNSRALVAISTRRKMGKLWLKNTILNHRHTFNNVSAQDFIERFKDMPLVIVSAGPSLQENINILKEFKDKVFIIAVGSAVGVLKKNNIRCDMAAFIDGQSIEENVFDSGKGNFDYILYASILYSDILDKSEVENIHVPLNMLKLDKWVYNAKGIDLNDKFKSGPSVANAAYDVAVKWGFNPIMLIGQDMAFKGDQYYAEGVVHGTTLSYEKQRRKRYIYINDIYGNEVRTDKAFFEMKRWFEDYNKESLNLPEIINCTEGGIGIENIPNKSLEETLNSIEYKLTDKSKYINSIYKEIKEKNHKENNVKDAYENLLKQVKRAGEIIRARIDIINNYIMEYEKNELFDDKFDKLITEDSLLVEDMEKECKDILDFMKGGHALYLFAKANRKLLQKVGDDPKKQQILELKGTMNQLVEKLQDIWFAKSIIKEAIDKL